VILSGELDATWHDNPPCSHIVWLFAVILENMSFLLGSTAGISLSFAVGIAISVSGHQKRMRLGLSFLPPLPYDVHFTCGPNRSDGSMMFENTQEAIFLNQPDDSRSLLDIIVLVFSGDLGAERLFRPLWRIIWCSL
jgi:hypothetical protein